jgi:hypothetical protein
LFSFALKIGVTRAIFRSSGIVPERKFKLNMCESGSEISAAIALITCELMPSYPGFFLNSNYLFHFLIHL